MIAFDYSCVIELWKNGKLKYLLPHFILFHTDKSFGGIWDPGNKTFHEKNFVVDFFSFLVKTLRGNFVTSLLKHHLLSSILSFNEYILLLLFSLNYIFNTFIC